MSSGQTFKSSSASQPKVAVKSEVATGQWHQAGDLTSGLLARIQKERLRQASVVASTANDPGDAQRRASLGRLAS